MKNGKMKRQIIFMALAVMVSFGILQSNGGNEEYQAIEIGPAGDNYSGARDINDRGEVVGYTGPNAVGARAVLWDNGSMIYLDPQGAYSLAWGINNRGQIVGKAGPKTLPCGGAAGAPGGAGDVGGEPYAVLASDEASVTPPNDGRCSTPDAGMGRRE